MRRTKVQADQTREAVVDAAEQVFFRRGVARASLEEVARVAGATRGAVYWHFKDKLDIFLAIEERVRMPQEEVMIMLDQFESRDALGFLETTVIEKFKDYSSCEQKRMQLTVLMLRCEYIDEMSEALARQGQVQRKFAVKLRSFFQDKVAKQLRSDIDPAVLAATFGTLVHGAILRWLRFPEDFPLDQHGINAVSGFFAMLRSLSLSEE